MNENLNLVEILKDCPKGTKLYSPVYGDVELVDVYQDNVPYPIKTRTNPNSTGMFSSVSFTKYGRIFVEHNGECMLFPSKDQRDWSKFKPKQPKFDPKTLEPFEKVLARDEENEYWSCTFFSRIRYEKRNRYKYATAYHSYRCCIPYNEETKHLVGTADEAPEYYRYWED